MKPDLNLIRSIESFPDELSCTTKFKKFKDEHEVIFRKFLCNPQQIFQKPIRRAVLRHPGKSINILFASLNVKSKVKKAEFNSRKK